MLVPPAALAQLPKGHVHQRRHRWVKKTGSIPTVDYHTAINRRAILTPATTPRDPADVMLSDISETLKDTACKVPPDRKSLQTQILRHGKETVPGAGGRGGERVIAGDRVSVWDPAQVWGWMVGMATPHVKVLNATEPCP